MINYGFVRVACATPSIKLADCNYNAKKIVELIEDAYKKNVSLIVFPELALSGYSCGDLFFSKDLQKNVNNALKYVIEKSKTLEILIIVGFPCVLGTSLYNCAAVICKGKILGIIPKTFIPNYSQYNELKYFTPGKNKGIIQIIGQEVPFGTDLIFTHKDIPEFSLGVEICEDFWVPNSPSNFLSQNGGATLIANLSASDEVVGKAENRRTFINAHSSKLISAYLYADAGEGESSSNLVFTGHNIISEFGEILAESELFTTGLIVADVDLQMLAVERQKRNTFNLDYFGTTVKFDLNLKEFDIKRNIPQNPFSKTRQDSNLDLFCEQVLELQVQALATRLKNINFKKVILGVSGGLDSALVLIVANLAFKRLKYDKKNIICVSMPGLGTSSTTLDNARKLVKTLENSYLEIPIHTSVELHFRDINKNIEEKDIVYENAQVRERTQILMDLANMHNSIVLGTCDLSELALGFFTYGGDHMSMYNVNADVPKIVVRQIVYCLAKKTSDKALKNLLLDILNIPSSPELLPTDSNEPAQITEKFLGPYELHDFFLYYFLNFGFSAKKILKLANIAFKNKYTEKFIDKCFFIFIKRFFENQFKRSCQPDGPKIFNICLSDKKFFSMPGDVKLSDDFLN